MYVVNFGVFFFFLVGKFVNYVIILVILIIDGKKYGMYFFLILLRSIKDYKLLLG